MNPLMVTAASYLLGPGGRQTGYLTTDGCPRSLAFGDRGRLTYHRADALGIRLVRCSDRLLVYNIGNRSDSCES